MTMLILVMNKTCKVTQTVHGQAAHPIPTKYVYIRFMATFAAQVKRGERGKMIEGREEENEGGGEG